MSHSKTQIDGRLFNRGFSSLLATQFFGAANDNILKQILIFMCVSGIWNKELGNGGLGEGGQAVPALLLTVPFIFLSGYAGQIADRISKRTLMVYVKLFEIPICMLAMVGFWTRNLWLTLAAMLFMSVQSTFFGPAKYGVVPQLTSLGNLSRANGLLNMLTNIAIILGSLVAGPLSDLYHPKLPDSAPVLWAPGIVMIFVALVGLASILTMPPLKAEDPELKFDLHPFRVYLQSLATMRKGPLLSVVFAWSGFYMVGAIALLILPEYESILAISFQDTSYLLGMLGVGIGLGSIACGQLSGDRIRPKFIPAGAIGMAICFLLLGLLKPTYANVATLISLAGLSAGFYIVPLQALLQHLSPDSERGRIVGTAGAISFMFSSLGAVVFWLLRNMPANRVNLLCGIMALTGAVLGIIQLRRLLAAYQESEAEEATL